MSDASDNVSSASTPSDPVPDNIDINAALGHLPDGSHSLSSNTETDPDDSPDINDTGDSLPSHYNVTNVSLPVKKKKNGHPLAFDTPQELETAVKSYFSNPANEPFTMSGLALACGVSRMTLLQYKGRNGFAAIVEWAKSNIEVQTEKKLFERGMSPTGAIFSLCNNFSSGWRQRNEIDQNIGGQKNNPLSINIKFIKAQDKSEAS
jgi:hypothetical protein